MSSTVAQSRCEQVAVIVVKETTRCHTYEIPARDLREESVSLEGVETVRRDSSRPSNYVPKIRMKK